MLWKWLVRRSRRRPTSEKVDEILRSMVSPRYFEIGDRMVAMLPELSAAREEFVEWWKPGSPGPINLIDELLTPFIRELLKDQSREDVLRRAFVFIEELASDPDADIREVAQETIDCIVSDEGFFDAMPLMGPKMREMVRTSIE